MIQGWNSLGKALPNEIFSYRVLCFTASPDKLLEIPSVTILHDYINFGILFTNDSIYVFDNICVIKFSQYINLWHYLLFLFFTHNAIIQLLPYEYFWIAYSAHFLDFTKRTYTNLQIYS